MATDLSQLITDFYSYFLGLYHEAKTQPPGAAGTQSNAQPAAAQPAAAQPATAQPATTQSGSTATPVGAFIAFESIGTPMTPEMFKLQSGDFDPGLVLQQFTLRANTIPVVDGTSISAPGLLSVDGAYELMLDAAQPLAAVDVEAFGHIKHSAQEVFENAVSNYSIPGLSGQFHPAVPGPPDWPSPTGTTAWTSRSFEQSTTVTVAVPDAPKPPVPPRPLPVWVWRVAPPELTVALKSTQAVVATVPPRPVSAPPAQVLAAHPVLYRPLVTNAIAARAALVTPAEAQAPGPSASPPGHPMLVAATPGTAVHLEAPVVAAAARIGAPTPIATHEPPVATVPPPRVSTPVVIRSDVMALHVQELGQQSTPQTVTSKNFKLSFDYCLVEAKREWMSGSFLTARNWYVPHTKAGEIASGTGESGGSFEVLPVAAIVVQNLVIEADWSHDDTVTLQSSVNFGPFSLVGRTIDQARNTLSCPGMQIVAWVFEPMPRLPPNSDPTMT
jgi:hypothetical protein